MAPGIEVTDGDSAEERRSTLEAKMAHYSKIEEEIRKRLTKTDSGQWRKRHSDQLVTNNEEKSRKRFHSEPGSSSPVESFLKDDEPELSFLSTTSYQELDSQREDDVFADDERSRTPSIVVTDELEPCNVSNNAPSLILTSEPDFRERTMSLEAIADIVATAEDIETDTGSLIVHSKTFPDHTYRDVRLLARPDTDTDDVGDEDSDDNKENRAMPDDIVDVQDAITSDIKDDLDRYFAEIREEDFLSALEREALKRRQSSAVTKPDKCAPPRSLRIKSAPACPFQTSTLENMDVKSLLSRRRCSSTPEQGLLPVLNISVVITDDDNTVTDKFTFGNSGESKTPTPTLIPETITPKAENPLSPKRRPLVHQTAFCFDDPKMGRRDSDGTVKTDERRGSEDKPPLFLKYRSVRRESEENLTYIADLRRSSEDRITADKFVFTETSPRGSITYSIPIISEELCEQDKENSEAATSDKSPYLLEAKRSSLAEELELECRCFLELREKRGGPIQILEEQDDEGGNGQTHIAVLLTEPTIDEADETPVADDSESVSDIGLRADLAGEIRRKSADDAYDLMKPIRAVPELRRRSADSPLVKRQLRTNSLKPCPSLTFYFKSLKALKAERDKRRSQRRNGDDGDEKHDDHESGNDSDNGDDEGGGGSGDDDDDGGGGGGDVNDNVNNTSTAATAGGSGCRAVENAVTFRVDLHSEGRMRKRSTDVNDNKSPEKVPDMNSQTSSSEALDFDHTVVYGPEKVYDG